MRKFVVAIGSLIVGKLWKRPVRTTAFYASNHIHDALCNFLDRFDVRNCLEDRIIDN